MESLFILANKNVDEIALKRKRATKIAITRLKNAQKCINNNELDKFYEEIEKALIGYFSEKFIINKCYMTYVKFVNI